MFSTTYQGVKLILQEYVMLTLELHVLPDLRLLKLGRLCNLAQTGTLESERGC